MKVPVGSHIKERGWVYEIIDSHQIPNWTKTGPYFDQTCNEMYRLRIIGHNGRTVANGEVGGVISSSNISKKNIPTKQELILCGVTHG